MIVRANGGYETNELYPSTNWYPNEPGNYVIDETTEAGATLANKIKENYPNYDLVIQNGVLVDVMLKEPETPVDPEPVKTPEQIHIEQLELDNEQLMIAVADLYEQVLALQGGL